MILHKIHDEHLLLRGDLKQVPHKIHYKHSFTVLRKLVFGLLFTTKQFKHVFILGIWNLTGRKKLKDEMLSMFLEKSESIYRESLRQSFSPVKLVKGEYLFFEGDKATNFYIVESGVLEVNAVQSEGRVYVFHFLFPGDITGEGCLYDQDRYPFSVTARKDSQVWRIKKSHLLENLKENPSLLKHLLWSVGCKLENAYAKARCITGERVEKRIACVLLRLADEAGISPLCGERFDSNLTNRDISGLIGSTEETVSRVMSNLKKEGVIATKGKELVILDREKLMLFFGSA